MTEPLLAPAPELTTDRLLLRAWRESDREAFAAINADPVVMELFPSVLDRAQSDDLLDRVVDRWRRGRPSLWAVEVPGVAPFIGFVGLLEPSFDASFTPCVEVGWRIGQQWWGQGFAPEGARAALDYGFDVLRLDEIVSFTSVDNAKSRRVMDKIGLHHRTEDDFDHPGLPNGHRLERHVLYRVSLDEWRTAQQTKASPAGSEPPDPGPLGARTVSDS